jgi:hypothetical protein
MPVALLTRESYGWTSARSRRETCGLGPPCLVKFVRIVREALAFSGLCGNQRSRRNRSPCWEFWECPGQEELADMIPKLRTLVRLRSPALTKLARSSLISSQVVIVAGVKGALSALIFENGESHIV